MNLEIQTIHLLVSDLYPGDAIGNFVLAVRDMLVRRGISAPLYAERADATLDGVRPYSAFFQAVRSEDTLLYQLSNHDPALPGIMAAPCRKVVYYHNITPGSFFAPYSTGTASLLNKGRLELPCVKGANTLLANSRYSLAEVEPFLDPTVPRAFFPPFLRGQLPTLALQTPLPPCPACVPSGPYLLILGRVVPHKRIEDSLRIFSLLEHSLPELRLVITGSQYDPYAKTLLKQVMASPYLSNRVSFTGSLSQEEVVELLRNAAGLLHASAHEGFCMPVFEAMLAGIPVFAHKQAAVAETLGGTGVLFDATDADQAAKCIRDTLFDPLRREHILAAQLHQAEHLLDRADEAAFLTFLLPKHFSYESVPTADSKNMGSAHEEKTP